MTTHMVDVNPAILIWARESVGLSREQAARKLRMTDLELRWLEEGVGGISPAKLRDMAEAYDQPFIAFFLDEPPLPEDDLPDFRLKPAARGKPWSYELHREFRRVAGQREVAIELARIADEPPPIIDLRLSVEQDPETAGAATRSWLGVPIFEAPVTRHKVFNSWVAAVEAKGILVTQVSGIKVSEMRGFSIGSEPFPVIAVNGSDYIGARTFTLMHELVHVLLRRAALCDRGFIEGGDRSDVDRLERFCDATAAATLMPQGEVFADESFKRVGPRAQWGGADLTALAGSFGVSDEAMLLRLVDLGRASWPFYLARRRKIENELEEDETPKGYITYYRKKIRNLGRRYIAMVLDAYDRGDISALALADYLDMRLANVPNLIARFGMRQ